MPQISNRNKHSIHQLISNFARQQNFLIKSCILPNHFAMLFDEYLADINNQLIVKIICERVSQLYLFQVKFIWAIELFSYSPLMKAFLLAKQENLFDGELHHLNWQSILENEDPYGTACVLVELKYADLLTKQTLQSLKYHSQPSFLINLLSFFSQIQKLNQENIELIFMHPDPILLNECLKLLIKKFIINMNNGLTIFLKLYHISDLSEFYETLNLMDRCRILNSEYFTMLLNHSYSSILGYGLSILNNCGILNGSAANSNFLKLYFHQHPVEFIYTLNNIYVSNLMHEDNAQHILDHFSFYQHIMFSNQNLWLEIDERLLREMHINNLISICLQFLSEPRRGQEMVEHYLQQFLIPNQHIEIFNEPQSTHTKSIHQAVAASAILLKNTYPACLESDRMDEILFDIKDYALELPLQKKYLVIKSSIFRLSSPATQFIEPISKLSLQQLLILFWVAIHDKNKRLCSLADGLVSFTEALYEIQREYNLDELGNDLGGEDQPACLSGSFNKLIEKLQGRYPGVELIYMSKYNASQKLKIICIEAIEQYMLYQQSICSDIQYHQLVLQLSTHGVEMIWQNISSNIKHRFYEEFANLFDNDPNHVELDEMITLSKDINIDWQQYNIKNTVTLHLE